VRLRGGIIVTPLMWLIPPEAYSVPRKNKKIKKVPKMLKHQRRFTLYLLYGQQKEKESPENGA
jgi:hypothetical protein